MPGQEHLGRVEGRLRGRDVTPAWRTDCERVAVAIEEHLLAADPAQDPQAGRCVGAERREPADLLALLALSSLERPDHEAERSDEHRHAEQDEQPEHRRRGEQDRRRRRRTRRSRPPSRAVMSKAPPARNASFETVATTSPVDSRRGRAGPSAPRGARRPGRAGRTRVQPVEDGVAVSHHAARGLDEPEPEQEQRPERERGASRSTMPCWIACPIANGISACATIQTMPNATPIASMPSWCLPTQRSSRGGKRVSGVPGSATGELDRGCAAAIARASGVPRKRPTRFGRHGQNERLVRDAVQLERLGPAGLGHPGGILPPGSLEPNDLAVALEREDVRRDSVEEPAIVADHDGTAGEVEQSLLERTQRVDVEVVGRLVEQEQVAAALEQLRQVDPVSLATGEVPTSFCWSRPRKLNQRHVRRAS